MQKIAVIGSGISGLTIAKLLDDRFDVTVFAKDSKPGGLVKCDRIKDNLFHRVGGHVFNSRNKEVVDWFWGQFDLEKDFIKAKRNAKILMNDKIIGYPLENFLSQLPAETVSMILDDMLALNRTERSVGEYDNFGEFLLDNFGKTLFKIYFEPYNNKIWNSDLSKVPLEWLDGKLPMPNLKQMLLSNRDGTCYFLLCQRKRFSIYC
jgi:protoporphyrinogen oxidase